MGLEECEGTCLPSQCASFSRLPVIARILAFLQRETRYPGTQAGHELGTLIRFPSYGTGYA